MEVSLTRSLTQKANTKSSILKTIGSGVKTVILPMIMCAAFLALSFDTANAQRSRRSSTDDTPPPTEGRQFGAKAGAIVNEALEFMTADNFTAANVSLGKALALPKLNAYERATIHQMRGQIYYELNQYEKSIQSFESAISSGGLLPKESSALRVNIAQLLIASGQPARGAQMMEDWNRAGGKLTPKHVEYLWQAWSQAENYPRALPWAEKWFNAARPKERKHYDLLNFM